MGLVALVLLSLAASWTPRAFADPHSVDLGGGVKLATWDFTTPVEYATDNVSLAPSHAALAWHVGRPTYTSDAEFAASASVSNGTRVSNGVRLDGDPSNRIADGGFDGPATWTYADGTTGEVTARHVLGRAQLGHHTVASSFDTLDALGGWFPVAGGDSSSILFLESAIVHQGTGSMRDDVYFGLNGFNAGAARDDVGTWDWSRYSHLAVWMDRTGLLFRPKCSLVLVDVSGASDAVTLSLGSGWRRYLFNVEGLAIDRAHVDRIELRFSDYPDMGGVVFVDDLVLLRLLAFDEPASVSQTFAKPATTGAPHGVVLTFDLAATSAVNVTASLAVTVGATTAWSESPVQTGTHSLYLDLSGDAALRGNASYPLSFALRLNRTVLSEASMDAWIDNVTLASPDYGAGSFTSRPEDAGSRAVWSDLAVNATTPAETALTVESRTGDAPTPDSTWSPWARTGNGDVPNPPARFLQWRLSLATTNGSLTPVVTRLAVTHRGYAGRGMIETAPFLPAEPMYRWREFRVNRSTPASTAIAFDASFDAGRSWVPVANGQDLSAYPREAVIVRATLFTADALATPSLASFAILYEYLGPMTSLRLTPANATVAWGDAVTFDAGAYDAFGHSLPVTCTWSMTDAAGNLTANATHAVFTASGVGTWLVRCDTADRAFNATATVTVLPNPLGRIDVSPANATISADDTLRFTANGYDTRGHALPITPTWNASRGSIDPSGLYTPGPPGLVLITATEDGVVGAANLTVLLGALARVDVSPATATIPADATLQFTAKGRDMRGNDVPIAPSWTATCGAVNATGLYVPNAVGSCTVYANANGIAGAARVTVNAGALVRLTIAPAYATITADDTVPFTATGYDSKGNAIPVTPTWTVEQGSFDAGGVYTPSYAGAWRVWARVGAVNASTRITVVPGTLATLRLSPDDVDVRADGSVQFLAAGYDHAGNPVPVSPTWTASNGLVHDGRFEPNRTGTWTVSAIVGPVIGNATVRVSPGAVARIVITPAEAELNEGEEMTFTAGAFDAKDNEVPRVAIAWSVEGDIGTIDDAGVFRATRGGNGRIVATVADGAGSVRAYAPVSVAGSPSSSPWLYVLLGAMPAAVLIAFYLRKRQRIASLRGRLSRHEETDVVISRADTRSSNGPSGQPNANDGPPPPVDPTEGENPFV